MIHSSVQSPNSDLQQFTAEELAQALMAKLAITDKDWHRLKTNRKARASEQVAAALVQLLKDQPDEALARLQQATGWLDRSISAPPCPTHGK
jgi:flagellar biosynthesis/type III secretory pathway chaperone